MKIILYHVLLETKEKNYSAEVAAETFTEAIELFKIFLYIEKNIEEYEYINVNGDHIGTHDSEEIVKVIKI